MFTLNSSLLQHLNRFLGVSQQRTFILYYFPFSINNSFIKTPSSWSHYFLNVFVISDDGTFESFFSPPFWCYGMKRRRVCGCGCGCGGWFWKKSCYIFFLNILCGLKNSPVLVFWERIIAAWVYLIRWRVGTRWFRVCIVIAVIFSRDVSCIPGMFNLWGWFWGGVEVALVEGGGVGMMVLRMGIWWRWR